MTWKIKEINKGFIVKGPEGSFRQYSRVDAEKLCRVLNRYEVLSEKVSEDLIREGKFISDLGKQLADGEVK